MAAWVCFPRSQRQRERHRIARSPARLRAERPNERSKHTRAAGRPRP